jgi:hypothetical protein
MKGDRTVDETGVRTLLNQLADTEPPPARIDLGAAIAAGRRGRHWRRGRVGGSVVLTAAAAAVAALLVVPGQRAGLQAAGGRAGPAPFSALVPQASFGWLPRGFQQSGVVPSSPARSILSAGPPNASIGLVVYRAGTCHLAGRTMTCHAFNIMSAAVSRAPDVSGHTAYWLNGFGLSVAYESAREAGLAWEYAPDAWSVLDWTDAYAAWPPAGAERAAVLRVAASVRYGPTAPIRFPFRISGLPTAWHEAQVDYTVLAGQPVAQNTELDDGPGRTFGIGTQLANADYLELSVTQVTHGGLSCPQGYRRDVTVDGVAAVLVYSPNSLNPQQLCIPHWGGLQVEMLLSTPVNAPAPNPTGPNGVLKYARMLHLLGPDPAHWTANPGL